MADLLLSRVLDVIVDNLAAPFLEKFDNLWDLEDNIRKLRSNLPMVQAVLEDAEEQQASNGAVRIWLSKLKEVAYEAESLLLLLSADYSLRKIIKDEEKVKETIRALEMTAVEGLRFNLKEGSIVHREWDRRPETSSFGLEQRVLGREKDKEEIVKLLLSCERSRGGEASCIPIIGMGGLGKTTLAQLAYNDHEVKRHFDVQVWVFVSDQFDVKNIMRTVIESLSKDKCHYPTLDALYSEVRNLLQNKRFLIVLDDVWTENSNDWDQLRPLFTADLSGSGLGILDGSFRALYYLKYLDLSHTRITKLPHEIEGLQFLETLNLFHCYDLIELPELRKMRSLRHLNNDGCRSLTRMLNNESKYVVGFGGFTSGSCSQLRTLPLFVVGDQNDFLFLHGLRLRGSLKVTHLENATGRALGFVGVESLGLYWGTDEGCPHINLEGEYVGNQFQGRKETSTSGTRQRIQYNPSAAQWLLENYKPADSLQVLLVKNYPGKSFPSIKARGLHNLSLISCENSENVPSLENVPNLTRLLLQEFNGVKSIDRNFGQFLALKELVLVDFPMLETWLSPGGGRVVFPNLRKLVLNKCPKLTVMPQILSIQHLDLRNCPAILVHSFQNLTSLEILVIQGVRDLLHFPAMFPSNNPLLTTLEIKSCSRLRSLPGELGNLSALKSLTIQWCENLFSLPQSLQNLSTLESLEIGDCHRLTSLPQGWTRGLGNLRSLSIENCSKLSSLSMECEHLISLKTLTIMYCPTICTLPEGVEHLSALQRLSILDLPELIYLPEGLQNLSLLHSLEIGSCPSLKHLPGWIDKLVSLRSLTISDCQDLRSLPEGLTCLTALQYLSIHDCPRLLERCKQERGEDWPKIAHVPHKNIGLPKLKRPREEGSSSTN
ncbi:hypothetical protein TIFTF001_045047 [Ficus carica]|uniref:Uncharacterized protein n=1 Tax=Ficus carica TaxID=3494 RepID=A0AA87ZEW9_FICCA|nr:hypothetical protein TIFTF001_045038 [Ficus carica]GMN35654.1 hypothetical protein TIFTF001_045041 [Ficus carica]GMN35678.1 hypothetical protein TIFTF001_045044 [Ficus carica]GMN35687.1 hypothetical protein TIFTF001_045047 [Ficus carica]